MQGMALYSPWCVFKMLSMNLLDCTHSKRRVAGGGEGNCPREFGGEGHGGPISRPPPLPPGRCAGRGCSAPGVLHLLCKRVGGGGGRPQHLRHKMIPKGSA